MYACNYNQRKYLRERLMFIGKIYKKQQIQLKHFRKEIKLPPHVYFARTHLTYFNEFFLKTEENFKLFAFFFDVKTVAGFGRRKYILFNIDHLIRMIRLMLILMIMKKAMRVNLMQSIIHLFQLQRMNLSQRFQKFC